MVGTCVFSKCCPVCVLWKLGAPNFSIEPAGPWDYLISTPWRKKTSKRSNPISNPRISLLQRVFLKSLHVTLPHQNKKKLNSCTKGTQTIFVLLVQLPEECSELGHLCHHDRMLRRVGRQWHNRMNQQDYVPTSTGRDDTERVISVFNAKGQKFSGWQCFKPALFQTKVWSKERSCPKIG